MNVFISYSSKEYEDAERLRTVIERNGFECWMAPKSIPAGSDYGSEIPAAIRTCDVFVLQLSQASQQSQWVNKELDRALHHNKVVIPFHIDNSDIIESFDFRLSNVQRLEAFEKISDAYKELIDRLKAIEQGKKPDNPKAKDSQAYFNAVNSETGKDANNNEKPGWTTKKKKMVIMAVIAAVLVIAAGFTAWYFFIGKFDDSWSLKDGVLEIGGEFDLCSYKNESAVPWSDQKDQIKKIVINDGVIGIGENVFANCENLTTVKIAASVTDIAGNAFSGCLSISDYLINADNQMFTSYNGVILSKDKQELVKCPTGKKGRFIVPEGIKVIREYAFAECGELTGVIAQDGLEEIGRYSFLDCIEMEAIRLPGTIRKIGSDAFSGCRSFLKIEFTGTQEQWDSIINLSGGEESNLFENIRVEVNQDESSIVDDASVNPNYEQAIEWYEIAANEGEAEAMRLLGIMYENGYVNGEPDYEKAFEWYVKAFDAGDPKAATLIGLLYESGHINTMPEDGTKSIFAEGTPDYEKAYEWFVRAKEAGDDEADEMIQKMIDEGIIIEDEEASEDG